LTARSSQPPGIPTFFVSLLIAILLAGCSTTDTTPGFSTFEEDGVLVAQTDPGSEYPSPVFRFEPILTMKEDPSQEESLLSRPSALFSAGPDGRHYVPDDR